MTAIGLGHPGSMRDEEGSESDRGKPSFRTSTPAPSSRRRWRARPLRKTHRWTPSAWQRLSPRGERGVYERGEAKCPCRPMCDLVCVFAIGLTISGDFGSRSTGHRRARWPRSVFCWWRGRKDTEGGMRFDLGNPEGLLLCKIEPSSTFGGMLHTLLRHLGRTQPPIHAGKSMLCGAELSVGVEGVFLASTLSPQRGWGGSL